MTSKQKLVFTLAAALAMASCCIPLENPNSAKPSGDQEAAPTSLSVPSPAP